MISDARASALVQEVLCVAPPTWLNLAEEHFLMNLDFFKPIQVKTHLVCWGGGGGWFGGWGGTQEGVSRCSRPCWKWEEPI